MAWNFDTYEISSPDYSVVAMYKALRDDKAPRNLVEHPIPAPSSRPKVKVLVGATDLVRWIIVLLKQGYTITGIDISEKKGVNSKIYYLHPAQGKCHYVSSAYYEYRDAA